MKKFLLALCFLPLLIAATPFTSSDTDGFDVKDQVYKIMEVAYLYDLLKVNYEPDMFRDGTWLEEGFRSRYAMAKKYASLEILESTYGTPVFLRGPHGADMDFNSKTSFGYYNPDFIKALRTSLEAALDSPVYRMVLKKLYTDNFKSMALTYQNAYSYLNNDAQELQRLKASYLMAMAAPGGISNGSLQEEFRMYADKGLSVNPQIYKTLNPNPDWYESVSAPAFWLRRSIDGTDKDLYDLLSMLINELG